MVVGSVELGTASFEARCRFNGLAASLVIEQWSGKLVPSRPILFDAEGSRLQKVSGVWALHSVPIFDVPLYT